MKGCLVFTWGRYGGFYVARRRFKRLCLGWLAIDYYPEEVEDLIVAGAKATGLLPQDYDLDAVGGTEA